MSIKHSPSPANPTLMYPTGFVPKSLAGQPPFGYQTCYGQGFMPTRDIAILPQELPFQNYAFHQTSNLPQMGVGGNDGIAQQVDIESTLREQSTRPVNGCIVYEFRDMGNFIPLICAWQQPDYRPLYFSHSTRQIIKNWGRAPDRAHGGGCAREAPNTYNKGMPAGPYGDYSAYKPGASYGGYCGVGGAAYANEGCGGVRGSVTKTVGV